MLIVHVYEHMHTHTHICNTHVNVDDAGAAAAAAVLEDGGGGLVFGAMLQGTTSSQVWASAVGSQPKGTAQRPLQPSLQGASVTLHIILLGVGGTIFNTHTLKPFKELGLDSQRVTKLASELHVHSVNFAAKLVHTRRALSSTVIDSHQEPVSGQACNLLDPH